MSFRSVSSQLRQTVLRFVQAHRGNVAVIFALTLVPVIGFVGAAVDYSRTNAARSAMQTALDSAALMVSKDIAAGALTGTDVSARTKTYFDALYTTTGINNVRITATYTANDGTLGSSVKVSASGAMPTQFMKLAGFPSLDFTTNGTATWGNSRMRVAMVLDVTGSMASDNKMPNLQKAANEMITTLSNLSKTPGDIYISVTPFAKDVNAGGGLATRDWVNWSEWEAEPPVLDTTLTGTKPSNWSAIGPGSDCPFTDSDHGFGCTDRPGTAANAASASKIPSSGTYAGYICPDIDSGRKIAAKTSVYYNGCYTSIASTATVSSCSNVANCTCTGNGNNRVCTRTTYDHIWRAANTAAAPDHSTWNGCVTDRNKDQNLDILNTAPQLGVPSTQFYAEQWSSCPPAVMPMTDQWSTLTTNITNMSPAGNTNQAIGLAWGWLSLTATAPMMTPAKQSGYTYDDYIVLVSDGLNTQDRWYNSASQIDDRQKLLCSNVKAAPYNVKIFTVQINTSTWNRDPESAVLKECASDGNFQMITSAADTATAFQKITSQLSRLRIAK